MSAHPAIGPAADAELGLRFFERMLRTRNVEDEVQRLFTQGLVRGTTHLCQGQEAVSVGVCGAMTPGDTMTCTYRGHGAVLAMGAPADEVFGEIMGRPNGLCGGEGGSMHLTDVRVGAFGSFAVVGAHLPIAVGLAFASRHLDSDSVSVCFFGDGTTNIGAFHETLNRASAWSAPVLFVCENNRYGEYSPQRLTTPIERLRLPSNTVGSAHLALLVTDIDERYERMLGQGVEFHNPPVAITGRANAGGFTCYFRDPDAITLELLMSSPHRLQALGLG